MNAENRAAEKSQPPLVRFGRYLERARKDAGSKPGTQQQVANTLQEILKGKGHKASVSQSLIAKYEIGAIGDPDPVILYELAKLYGKDYLEMVARLVREKYQPDDGRWNQGVDAEKWAGVEAVIDPPPLMPEAEDMDEHLARSRTCQIKSGVVLDIKAMAAWQQTFKGLERFWVIAPNFLDQNEDIFNAVVHNLARQVQYDYFIYPRDFRRFLVLKDRLQQGVGKKVDVDARVRAYQLDIEHEAITAWLATVHLVANPHKFEKAVAYQCVREHGKAVRAFRLKDQDAESLLSQCWTLATPEHVLPKLGQK